MTDGYGKIELRDDRYFGPDANRKRTAIDLYQTIKDLPLICPHGHVDPRLFADPNYTFGNPAELLIVPDHYIFRMLYSQGISLESLGIPRLDGGPKLSKIHAEIWQRFADHFYLFRGTPTGVWLTDELLQRLRRDHEADGRNGAGNLRPDCGQARIACVHDRGRSTSNSTSRSSAPPTRPPIPWPIIRPSVRPAGRASSVPPSGPTMSSTQRAGLAREHRCAE